MELSRKKRGMKLKNVSIISDHFFNDCSMQLILLIIYLILSFSLRIVPSFLL
jgi:hypothetical protein